MDENHHCMVTVKISIIKFGGELFSDVGRGMLQLDSEISLLLDTFAQHL